MEIAEHINEQEVAQVWALDRLRTVRYDATSSTIFARSRSMSQRIYYFDTDRHSDLVIRRTTGLPLKSTISDLIWVSANFPEGNEIQIGLDSAYIFEQTGSLITPQTVDWGGEGTCPSRFPPKGQSSICCGASSYCDCCQGTSVRSCRSSGRAERMYCCLTH